MPDFVRGLASALADYPVYIRRLEQRFLERQFSNMDVKDAKLAELLEQYCTSVRMEADILYNEELLSGANQYILPAKYRFASCVEEAVARVKSGESEELLNAVLNTIFVV